MFYSKQAAEKGARRPSGVPRSEAKKVGVLGVGMMGAGIAYVSANAGIEVILLDRAVTTAEKGKAYSSKVLGKLLEKGVTRREKAEELMARIKATDAFKLKNGRASCWDRVRQSEAIPVVDVALKKK